MFLYLCLRSVFLLVALHLTTPVSSFSIDHPSALERSSSVRRTIINRRGDAPDSSDDGICEYSPTGPNQAQKRALNQLSTITSLNTRAPTEKAPLAEPESNSDADFAKFMLGFAEKGNRLEIWPSEAQTQSWKVKVGRKTIPVGATGVAFLQKEGKQLLCARSDWMHCDDCYRLWTGHLWEGSTTIGGPSAFRERIGPAPEDYRDRPMTEFRAVALDILGLATPKEDKKSRPLWKSLVDIKQSYHDPFGDGRDTEIFVLTKAIGAKNRNPKYQDKIQQLRHKFVELIPGAEYVQKTYRALDPSITLDLRGMFAVQYTPYDHDGGEDNCTPMARVRIYYENNKTPVIDKSWPATGDQINTKRRRDTCIGGGNKWPIKTGYVAFGDSYAAGMGTGITTSDSCRIGTANVGDLIYAHTNLPGIDYQRKMCSGDTITGFNRQINEWTSPEKSDLATVTMGGNDVGFSDIVSNCLLKWDPLWPDFTYTNACNAAKKKANEVMEDSGENGIGSKLAAAYKRVVEKSTRKDFHLYVSGYPSGFFRTDDAQNVDCKNTYFNWIDPHYCPRVTMPCYSTTNVYLTVALREELNDLVVKLNKVIAAAVDSVNAEIGAEQVHFIDVGPYYDNHRWCEKNDDPEFHEPSEGRAGTWFFLSGWKDVDPTTLLGALGPPNATSDTAGMNVLMEQGSVKLPPAETCESQLGTDPDPNAKWLCMVSQRVADTPNGFFASNLKQANADIAAKNYSSTTVSWYMPTRQVKTFHPRTPGMHAYRDSIIDAINRIQVNGATPSTIPKTPTGKANTCTGTIDDSKVHWSLTIDTLTHPDDCDWASGGFPDCFGTAEGGTDCALSAYTPACKPSDHSQGFSATFDTTSQCDPDLIDSCISSSFSANGTIGSCTKVLGGSS